jgi:hypothetical protein
MKQKCDDYYEQLGINMELFYEKGFNKTLRMNDINNMILNDDLKTIRKLIKCGLEIDYLDELNLIKNENIPILYENIEHYILLENYNERRKKLRTIKFLLRYGAIVDFIVESVYEDDEFEYDKCYDNSIFDIVISDDKHTELLDLILTKEYEVNINMNRIMYNTLMKLIIYDYDISYMKKVIDMKININYCEYYGNNALLVAIRNFCDINVLCLLVESGININKINRKGENALLMELNYGNNKTKINYLIENGINIYKTIKMAIKLKMSFKKIRFLYFYINIECLFKYRNINKYKYIKRLRAIYKYKSNVPIGKINYIYKINFLFFDIYNIYNIYKN